MKNDSLTLPSFYILNSGNLSLWIRRGFLDLDLAIRAVFGDDLYLNTSWLKIDNTTLTCGSTRSKEAEEIYEKAMRAIKSGRLRARKMDQRDSQGGEFVAVKFVRENREEQTWNLNPKVHGVELPIKDFIQWVLVERIAISERTSQLFGLNNRFRGKFHPKRVIIQATAQAIWDYMPSISISQLENHWLIQKIIGRRYDNRKSFRDIVKSVDPRPELNRYKPKLRIRPVSVHYPPKPIPGISLPDQAEKDFLTLKTACKALFNALKLLDPSLPSSGLISHPLVELCLVGANEIIKDMSLDWLDEVEADFPISLDNF